MKKDVRQAIVAKYPYCVYYREDVKATTDWRWSSAKFYATDGQHFDPLLPKITPLPGQFWDTRLP